MNWNKPVKFKVGDVDWEMPLSTLVLLLALTLVLMVGGAWLGYQFGSGKSSGQRLTVHGPRLTESNFMHYFLLV